MGYGFFTVQKIEGYITDIIRQNAGVPNYKLPSERTLSIMFETIRNPVRHAYDKLIQRGLVVNIHGKGYFISQQADADSLVVAQRDHKKYMLPLLTASICV